MLMLLQSCCLLHFSAISDGSSLEYKRRLPRSWYDHCSWWRAEVGGRGVCQWRCQWRCHLQPPAVGLCSAVEVSGIESLQPRWSCGTIEHRMHSILGCQCPGLSHVSERQVKLCFIETRESRSPDHRGLNCWMA